MSILAGSHNVHQHAIKLLMI